MSASYSTARSSIMMQITKLAPQWNSDNAHNSCKKQTIAITKVCNNQTTATIKQTYQFKKQCNQSFENIRQYIYSKKPFADIYR